MADEKKTPKFAAPNDASVPFDGILAFNRNAFEAWAHNMSKLSQEMAQFMQSRLREEATMWEKLASCRDPSDVVQCQSEFASKTGTDYAAAAQKLSRLMLDFASGYGSALLHPPTETD
ncbi:MAG TPA: phasin family protein [Stellaceae bacterium]|nr:phasin family protein [Stellaceae bacterium]